MRFAFVIPLVHPEHKRIKNYERTLSALRLTLDCLSGQEHDDVFVVVCCHKLPSWHHKFESRVHFLLLEAHRELPFDTPTVYGNESSEVDKGIKLTIGFAFARDFLNADYVMFMDADDFARKDLVSQISTNKMPKIGKDGWNIVRGYNVEIDADQNKSTVRTVYEVRGFHRNCGSCRIFSSTALDKHMNVIAPSFECMRNLIPAVSPAVIKHEIIEAILHDIRANNSQNAPFMVFAHHKRQERMFDLTPVHTPFMAKGCGHSNHAGQSDIYWYRVIRQCVVDEFMKQFALEEIPSITSDPDPISHVRTFFQARWSMLLQIPHSLKVRYQWLLKN